MFKLICVLSKNWQTNTHTKFIIKNNSTKYIQNLFLSIFDNVIQDLRPYSYNNIIKQLVL